METKQIPRRKFILDIDGKKFTAKELSMVYLDRSDDDDDETVEEALKDSIGEITAEDLKNFGIETKSIMYMEIMKFTFADVLTDRDVAEIKSHFGISEAEIMAMSKDTKLDLKQIIESRKPRDTTDEKKNSGQ